MVRQRHASETGELDPGIRGARHYRAAPQKRRRKRPRPRRDGSEAGVKPADTKADLPIELPPGDGPVAKVNDVEIPREMFNREFTQTIERYRRRATT